MMPPRPDPAPLSARWQELFWALPPGPLRSKLRALEADTGATVRALQQRNEALYEALRRLMNESSAVLALSEPELRAAGGHTNVACFRLRIDEAAKALQEPHDAD